MKILLPNRYFKNIYEVDLKDLKDQNIKALIIDIDNTLVGWDVKSPTKEVLDWLELLKENDFKICLVSNNKEDRVLKFTEDLNIDYIFSAKKPFKKSFKKALKILGESNNNTAIIGDQIFTDVLGGNRSRIFKVLVEPIKSKEFWWTTLVRNVEKIIIKKVVNKKFK